ncbi:MAG: T9SS type A sorting domain-containing protein [Bacteroidetes bacterium]|nr:MAG: T9SS type A sorting domain-containing protein [Bacteroidota bacterium]
MKVKLHFIICLAGIFMFSFNSGIKAQALAGNYTINSAIATGGTNFQSFNDFASSINSNGVSANVIATVEPGSGPYQESVIFSNITGTSSGATITLEGSGETITALTTTTDRHVVRLTDCSFFTINNLYVTRDPASTGGFYGIHIFNTGYDITISNCNIDIGTSNSTLHGSIVASGSETSILTTGDFHRLTITGNTTRGGGYGVSVFGLISNLASDILIEDNDIMDFHDNGVYLRETNGALINGNRFDKNTGNTTGINAIQIAQAANINTTISNNFIKISQTTNGTMTIRGIYLFNGTGHKVFNNVIHDVNLVTGNFVGIEVRTGATSPKIYFNTISLDNPNATSGNLYGIKEELSNTNSEIRNNMISISQSSSGIKAALVLGATATLGSAFNSDYNNMYVPGGNIAMKSSSSPTFYPTITDWQNASTQDMNSSILDPAFVSMTDPTPTNLSLDNTGITIAGYDVDVLGNLRNMPPDIGAIEFIGTGINKISGISSLDVYPNPVKNYLTVKMHPFNSNVIKISIYSQDGKLLQASNENISATSEIIINTESFSQGLYFIKAISEAELFQGSFVKF